MRKSLRIQYLLAETQTLVFLADSNPLLPKLTLQTWLFLSSALCESTVTTIPWCSASDQPRAK